MLAGFVVLGRMSDVSYAAAYRLAGLLEIACGALGVMVLGVAFARRRGRARQAVMPAAAPVVLEGVGKG